MKKFASALVLAATALSGLTFAQQAHDHQHGSSAANPAPDKAAAHHGSAATSAGSGSAKAAVLGSTLKQRSCPVSGKPVKPNHSLTHKGQKVYLCCDGCIAPFQQAPIKHLPALYRQIYPQLVQAVCPVMGGAVDSDVFVEHEDQKVYFCCEGCDKKFKADPAKYAAKLQETYSTQVHCPVSGRPIDLTQSIEEKDRTVYFCCKGCVAKYQADPKKYAQSLLPEVGVVAYGSTAEDDLVTTPACAGDKATYRRAEVQSAVHQGKVYFLSSDDCAKAFRADPARHVRRLTADARPGKPQPEAQSASPPKP